MSLSFRAPAAALAALAVAGCITVHPTPAPAAAASTIPDPLCAPSGAAADITLGADEVAPAGDLVITCDATIDLAGHQLTLRSIQIVGDVHVAFVDSSAADADGYRAGRITVDATGTELAGIGLSEGASVVLDVDGTRAVGGADAAGIGTGRQHTARDIEVRGRGTVAFGGEGAAGIGAGESGHVNDILITGNDTHAYGGPTTASGAGIGTGIGEVTTTGAPILLRSTVSSVIVSGHRTVAQSYGQGAGIGSSTDAEIGTIRISGDDTQASSGDFLDATASVYGRTPYPGAGAGIGGGAGGRYDQIEVTGAGTRAESGMGAGIGNGAASILGLPVGPARAGSILVSGDDTAARSNWGAGIGGGISASPERIEISGERVFASSQRGGAGVGTGYTLWLAKHVAESWPGDDLRFHSEEVAEIVISGGSLTAVGGAAVSPGGTNARGAGGAAIGGGQNSPGGSIVIHGDAEVTLRLAEGDEPDAAPRHLLGGDAWFFGEVRIEGLLRIDVTGEVALMGATCTPGAPYPDPAYCPAFSPDRDVEHRIVVTSTGSIVGPADDPTAGPNITGEARIANSGVITLARDLLDDDIEVLGNHTIVSFDGAGEVTVFAPTMRQGERPLPDLPDVGDGLLFLAWEDAAGEAFDIDTALPHAQTTEPARLDLTARTVAIAADEVRAELSAGGEGEVPLVLRTAEGTPVDVAEWSVVDAPAEVTASIASSPARLVVSAETSGEYEVTLRARADAGWTTAVALVSVAPADVARVELDVVDGNGGVVMQGDSITLTATGFDAYGNSTGDLSDDVEVSSDQPADVIDGMTVTFMHASPHRLTVTHVPTGVFASVVVEVTPVESPADDLVVTGAAVGSRLAWALALVAVGIVMLRVRRVSPGSC